MSNGFIYVVDAHFIDKIEEEENILDPSACERNQSKTSPALYDLYNNTPSNAIVNAASNISFKPLLAVGDADRCF